MFANIFIIRRNYLKLMMLSVSAQFFWLNQIKKKTNNNNNMKHQNVRIFKCTADPRLK